MQYGKGMEFEKLEIALERAGMAWWWLEFPTGAVFFSPNKARIIGENPADFLHYTDFTKRVHPDDYDGMMDAMTKAIKGETDTYCTIYRIKAKDGSYKRFFDKGRIVSRTPDGDITFAGMVVDIADVEAALAEHPQSAEL